MGLEVRARRLNLIVVARGHDRQRAGLSAAGAAGSVGSQHSPNSTTAEQLNGVTGGAVSCWCAGGWDDEADPGAVAARGRCDVDDGGSAAGREDLVGLVGGVTASAPGVRLE